MIEGLMSTTILVLKHIPEPWTFTRAYVNDFFEMGSVGLWEDHEWPEWTSIVRTMQIAAAHILIERDTAPLLDAARYFLLAQDKDEDEEDDDEEISYWSESNYGWSLDGEDKVLTSKKEFSGDVTEAMHVWGPLKDEDLFMDLKTLFKEENEKEGNVA